MPLPLNTTVARNILLGQRLPMRDKVLAHLIFGVIGKK